MAHNQSIGTELAQPVWWRGPRVDTGVFHSYGVDPGFWRPPEETEFGYLAGPWGANYGSQLGGGDYSAVGYQGASTSGAVASGAGGDDEMEGGANPPWEVIENYVYRVWKEFGVDRVSFLNHGMFIVRFAKHESREALLNVGYYLFDNKPVIIKPWVENMEFVKEKVDVVPVWVRLAGIPLKFWGDCLPKIAGLVGKFVQSDKDTYDKVRLSYARVLVELQMDQKLPDSVKLLDDYGNLVKVRVDYEWRPISCASCTGLGHDASQCRKPKKAIARKQSKGAVSKPQKTRIWRPVVKLPVQTASQDPPVLTPAMFPPLASARSTVKPTPAKNIMRLNRQDGIVGVRLSGKFSQYTFLDALNNSVTPKERKVVKWFMHNNGVGLFGLLETKIKPSSLLKKDTSLCEGWSVTTNCSWHKGGRIWIMWKPTLFELQFLAYDAQYIHMLVTSRLDGKQFYLTMIYAHNGLLERVSLWNFLKDVAQSCNEPWLWLGDFNTVLSPIERLGGSTTDGEMEHFQECVSICYMEDLSATGALFTWSNKQEPVDRVYSRLDRAMGNPEWLAEFGDFVPHFHPEGIFYHCPCTLVDRKTDLGGKRSFKYFNMWGSAATFHSDVSSVWTRQYKGTKMFVVVKKLKALKPVLKQLNKSCFYDNENSTSIAAKIQWSIEGDLNTSYFHHVIKKRNMLNKVFQIEDHHGVVCTEGASIQAAFLEYYQELLGTQTEVACVNQTIVRRGNCCTEDHLAILAKPITADEVKHSILSIPKDKAPGPDGYNSQFYRDAWDVVGDEICSAIMNFFSIGQLLVQVNSTIVTLIPKVDRPTSVKHFRPISCCNVLYKAISKILCARLALILPDLINRSQGAFVKGRSILENILICQDLVRVMDYAVGQWYFRFHPLCKSLRLTHLLFADDLLMFCRGDVRSIMLILRALSTFSDASGLKVNADKSEVVFNGVPEWLKADITHISGFQEGSLPFKYLGVPVQPGRLSRSDCYILIEKIVQKIRGIGARKMSYAGRLVLINSVLNTLHNNWSSIFLIPKGVIQRIEAICRNFLWSSDEVYHMTPLVAWEKVCCSKQEGGLGIYAAGVWNIAVIGKLVNWIYTKADRLWVLWVDHVYLKGSDWNDYQPSLDSNWNWRNICKVKDVLAGGFQDNQWVAASRGYSVSSGYQWIRGPHPPVQWSKAVCDRWNIPKQTFVGWLIYREALNIRAKLHHPGLCDSELCVLCERGVETHAHLFSECAFSSQILIAVEHWLQLKFSAPCQNYSKLQLTICNMVKLACWYHIWHERNRCRVEFNLRRHVLIVNAITEQMKSRLKKLVQLPVASSDRLWLTCIGIVIDV
ncbi:uncharacterized protein LOC141619998 [Silene latifolia]|uniref:uncharacterized protein LOC141619998 n=1 Tax=Silene latifolia TaxID=37657 RepID=UPI003D76C60A